MTPEEQSEIAYGVSTHIKNFGSDLIYLIRLYEVMPNRIGLKKLGMIILKLKEKQRIQDQKDKRDQIQRDSALIDAVLKKQGFSPQS